jgi:hypothetical protein
VSLRTPKRKRARAKREPPAPVASGGVQAPDTAASEIGFSDLSLHQLFEHQAADMLDRADLDEEQKQSVMLAMSCPCCGAGGPSFSFKLKRRT